MINQLNSFSADKNVFTPLQSNGVPYSITKPITDTQIQTTKEDIENKKEKKNKKLGYAMASIALCVGFGIFVVTRLLSKKSRFNVNKIVKFLDEKVAKLSKNKQTTMQQLAITGLRHVKNLFSKAPAVFNLATVKDILFRRYLNKTNITRKFNDGLTNWFEKVSVATTKTAYLKTFVKFDNLYSALAHTNKKLPIAEREKAVEKIKFIKSKYDEAFSTEARVRRLEQVDKDLEGFEDKVWKNTYGNIQEFWENAKNGKFMAEELATDAKLKLHNSVIGTKEKISLNTLDNYLSIKKMLGHVDNAILPTDMKLRDALVEVRKNLELYRKNNNIDDKSGVIESLTKFSKVLSIDHDPKVANEVLNTIELLSKSKKGAVQELMEIYENNLSKEDFDKLQKTVNSTLRSLNYSVDLETDKLFDKIRDLKIGSAPHDFFAFLSSLAIVGWYLGKADNNDERMSVALKYGIPVVGAVAITTMCAVGLIASGPSLLIGLVSGLAINKLGEVADEMRKKYKDKPLTLESALPDLKEGIEVLEGKDTAN